VEAITLSDSACILPGTFTEALTDNYLKLRLQARHDPNRWLTARIESVEDGTLVGHALSP
jgi:hypothetical protein